MFQLKILYFKRNKMLYFAVVQEKKTNLNDIGFTFKLLTKNIFECTHTNIL